MKYSDEKYIIYEIDVMSGFLYVAHYRVIENKLSERNDY